ncbi:MAG: carbohydrate kinase family protein [Planctomycetota bacterium]
MTSPEVVCVGNANVDLFIPHDSMRLGHRERMVVNAPIAFRPGGNALATATVLGKCHVSCGLCSCIGVRGSGQMLQSELDEANVVLHPGMKIDTSSEELKDEHTGLTFVNCNSGSKPSFVTYSGTNAMLNVDKLDMALHEGFFDNAKVLFLGSFGVLPGLDAQELVGFLHRLRERRKGDGGVFVMAGTNLITDSGQSTESIVSSEYVRESFRSVSSELDCFIGNVAEIAQIMRRDVPAPGTKHVERLVGVFSDKYQIPIVGMTLAENGSILSLTSGGSMSTHPGYVLKDDFPEVDRAGVGDAWNAGFIVEMIRQNKPMRDLDYSRMIERANQVAVCSMLDYGTTRLAIKSKIKTVESACKWIEARVDEIAFPNRVV